MLVKTVKYTDFNGVEKIKECHFHLSKREMLEMQASVKGGLDKFLKKMLAEKDVVNLDNIWMRQDGNRLGFIFEATAELFIRKKFFF